MFNVFFTKSARIPVSLYNNLMTNKESTVTTITRSSDISYSHVHEIIQYMQEQKLLDLIRNGRRDKIILTPAGVKFVTEIKSIINILGGAQW